IVFDFDGVIVESNQIKNMAFNDIFKDYPEHNEIMAYHFAHNAVDRYQKFHDIAKNILRIKRDTKGFEEGWANLFRELTRTKIISCPFVEGAKAFLDYIKEKKMRAYLASATPQDELEIILQARGLNSYFEKTFGSPIVKSNVLKQILIEGGYQPEQLLFIGDSREDQKSAMQAGVSFVGRISDFKFEGVPAFGNLMEIFGVFKTGGQFELFGSAL
ncbi:MAG: HAD family hydrolase, partial [Bdellovibrionales bacterium]|nr:HAD family hydrolase [Bdellovibrionales bacterium]